MKPVLWRLRGVSVLTLAMLLVSVAGCACPGHIGGSDSGGGSLDANNGFDSGSPFVDSGIGADSGACEAPDMLIVLDRTMSMHRRPDGTIPPDTPAGHMESKWYIAIDAIETLTASLDTTIRFGLELFPEDPGGNVCVTLSERIQGITASNPGCQPGEVPILPAIGTGAGIASLLDPETTVLCTSTPIGAGLGTAVTELAAITDPIRDQYALLLTDGQDTCDEALSLGNAQALAAAGVSLYVIGFDGSGSGVDHNHLNDLACAGHTAPGFPAPCTDDGAGNFTATDPAGAMLYLSASNAATLVIALEQVAGSICCNCIL